MGKRQVLNILHALLICNVRTVSPRNGSQGFEISRAHCQLLVPLLFVTTMAIIHPWLITRLKKGDNVDWFTVLGRVVATLLIVALLIMDSFWKRHQLLALLKAIPSAMASGTGEPNLGHVRRLHLCTLALCDCLSILEGSVRLLRNRSYIYLPGIFAGLMIEHYILLNAMLCQLIAEFVAEEYAGTVYRLLGAAESRSTITQKLKALEHCKSQLNAVLGWKLLLVLLHLLLNISFCTYDVVQKLMYEGELNDVARLGLIATLDSVTLFVLCYYFDLLHGKEAELKNALKTMQYSNIEHQSIDQKDFYDLINLKLMMESPKITACGLFEINLEVFYNVFAAIITYIVILFQFRSFETSP
ncbi:uncharacterized protein LOC125957663 isoform X3 [Anopheles darlingi]|uniref:uncharacterized protein LOC125957663 isoform X3 n=1 Tax=Anopheles darlingi TaxID=43151 RepID=UPI002100213B|nr:uncharacterized protein LOC125957663 isoform X3 [Anopheles darlingi]XP_049546478.1 uncharacterized protein LOC125957663 isoform X3 [Anopheles darlingi]XP_049546479.1 uncharacterized protein LOC125957663 isoform X3 [Anopheles darlingi]